MRIVRRVRLRDKLLFRLMVHTLIFLEGWLLLLLVLKKIEPEWNGLKKPAPPVLPRVPDRPQMQDISKIREIPVELENVPFFIEHVCPITGLAILNPVKDSRYPQHVYEQSAIYLWVMGNGRSPLNGEAMNSSDLIPDVKLKGKIDEQLRIWVEKKYGEDLKKYEEKIQSILARHNEAMQKYEAALKELEEAEETNQDYSNLGIGKTIRPAELAPIQRPSEKGVYSELRNKLLEIRRSVNGADGKK